MELLGEHNWWIPRWLDRILPNIQIEGTPDPSPADDDDGTASGPHDEIKRALAQL